MRSEPRNGDAVGPGGANARLLLDYIERHAEACMVPDGAWAAKAMVRQHQAIPVEPRGADFAIDFAVVAAAPDGVAGQ